MAPGFGYSLLWFVLLIEKVFIIAQPIFIKYLVQFAILSQFKDYIAKPVTERPVLVADCQTDIPAWDGHAWKRRA